MALEDNTVDVLHPNGSVMTLPSWAVPPGATIVPQQVQTIPEYPTTTGPGSGAGPQPQRLADVPEYPLLTGPIASLPPAVPPTQKLGVNGGTGIEETGAPPPEVPSVTGGQLSPGVLPSQLAPTESAPTGSPTPRRGDYIAGTLDEPSTLAEVAKSNAAYAKQQAAPSVAANAQLASMGEGDVLAAHQKALDEEKAAGEAAASSDYQHHLAFAAGQQQYADKVASLVDQQTKDAQAAQQQYAKIAAERTAMMNQYMNTKIDRSVDHPIIGALAVILGGISQTMTKGTTNPGIDALYQSIDRKVNGQMQDLTKLQTGIGMKGTQLEEQRQMNQDKTADYNQRMAGELGKWKAYGDALAARSSSDQVKTNWAITRAGLDAKQADFLGNAIDKTWDRTKQQEQMALTKRGQDLSSYNEAQNRKQAASQFGQTLAENKREHDLQRQDRLDQIAEEYAKLGQTGKAAKAKDVADNGVFDPTSGQAVLTPEGQKINEQADNIEKAARSAPLEQQPQMLANAKNLRNQAEAVGGFTIADKDTRRAVVKSVGAGQKLIDTADRIKDVLAQDPSSIDRTTWASLETDFESAKADWIEAHGAKASSREFQAIGPMFGDDPSSMTARITGRGKMVAALDSLVQNAIGDTTTDLRTNGYKGDWIPRRGGSAVPTLGGKTSVERADDATPGVAAGLNPFGEQFAVAKTARTAGRVVFGGDDVDPRVAAENSGQATPTGLSPSDTNIVTQLARGYDKASIKDQDKMKAQLRAYASSDRASLAQGVMTLLNAENPALYGEIAKAAPGAPRAAADAGAALPAVLASTPIDNLRMAAIAGDMPSKSELARRASRGDKLAGKAILDVVNAQGSH